MEDIDESFFYTFDSEEYNKLWAEVKNSEDPVLYKTCIITPRALITMVDHAIAGDRNEILGFCLGKATKNTILVNDVFSTTTLGTETNCYATTESYVQYFAVKESLELSGRQSANVSGWYHSHPDYGCWLSTTDVIAQNIMQATGPMVALVVDPIKTANTGKVFLGAFRNFPQSYISSQHNFGNSLIPSEKIKDYGASAGKYYQLAINYFLTDSDKLVLNDIIQHSWGEELAESPLIANSIFIAAQINDQAAKRINMLANNVMSGTDIETLKNIVRGINEDRRAGIMIQKMKSEVFG
ncbi:Clan MP, family M67, Poh1-like metallopeptidase [Trichomonas vaginalis G3]|uniref:Clan MP, family M67, Poh1-like metallopeptidase n=1 Tax=Trichomonas vaginalis (strain ATCC PRA-98 / G3) TaxID=412133 RepID=A2F5S7_TRIV3|nr:protein deneddylation [Trichomonas vaginalis G3]EAX99712.1 Clan MP, family M67, Poh1-like metallopeptidase [Trichomonas vaginalis G3]KAI5501431.1 protein deneddylation [Trichomonas vaginalis G3]|eukprot:XP_001312642.1 Clan MP, family M67, Poh1-like metallopeptidase [Trichomonas vaginalis G3]